MKDTSERHNYQIDVATDQPTAQITVKSQDTSQPSTFIIT